MNEDSLARDGLVQSQGTLEGSELPAPRRDRPTTATSRGLGNPRQFLDEVLLELRKVMRPKRSELINYSVVVFFTLAFIMALVYGLDYVYSLGASNLFK
jgi:preprotein translocase subunit SecE